MAFNQALYDQFIAQGVPAPAAVAAATTPDAAPAPAPTAPPANFTPPPTTAPGASYAPAPGTQQSAPQPEAARGTVEDFWNQPTGGNGGKGASSYFKSNTHEKPQNSWLQFTVDRDVNGNDVQQMTKFGTNILETWQFGPQKDKPKFQLIVPGTVIASGDSTHDQFFEGGALRLYLKPGPVSDAFRAALQAGGESSGFPKAGSTVVMVKGGQKPNKSGNPTQLYDFTYTAPNGVAAPATAVAETAVAEAAPVAPPTVAAPVTPAPVTQTAPVPSATPTDSAPVAPAADGQSELDAKKAALLAQLAGLNG
jgi:hypothetical protein